MEYNQNLNNLSKDYIFCELKQKAQKKEGQIIDLSIGDVTLPLPQFITDAMSNAAKEYSQSSTFKGYPPTNGYPFLIENIIDDYQKRGVQIYPDEIFISNGAKDDLSLISHLFGKCKVLLTTPCYPAYIDVNTIFGNQVTIYPTSKNDDFVHLPPYSHTYDIIYLCSPSNPTGVEIPIKVLMEWINYATNTGAVIIFDNAYSAFSEQGLFSIYKIKGARNCVIEVNSFSKNLGFTGLRCGYTVIPQSLGKYNSLFKRIKGCAFNGVNYITQVGASQAFTEQGKKYIADRVKFYKANADILRSGLKKVSIEFILNQSSPYVFAKSPKGQTSQGFCDQLLEKCNILATPGNAFGVGGEGYFRLSAFPPREKVLTAYEHLCNLKL